MSDQVVKSVGNPDANGAAKPKAAAPVYTRKDARTKTIKLEWPLEYDGVTYTEVTARRLTGKDILSVRKLAASGGDMETAMFAMVCDIPVEVIEALDAQDVMRVVEAAQDFLPQESESESEQTTSTGTNTPQT